MKFIPHKGEPTHGYACVPIKIAPPNYDKSYLSDLQAKGEFKLRRFPAIYDVMCQQLAGGVRHSDIINYIKDTYGVVIPSGTIAAAEHTKTYARLIARYRKNIGPLLRQIPGAHKLQRIRALSNIALSEDEDSRTKILALHELETQTSDEKTAAMLTEYESDDIPDDIKKLKIITAAVRLMGTKLSPDLLMALEESVLKIAEKIKKLRASGYTKSPENGQIPQLPQDDDFDDEDEMEDPDDSEAVDSESAGDNGDS